MPITDLLRPIITEKSLRLATAGKFSFYVTRQATKTSLKQAVETMFSVNVVKINVVSLPPKNRRSGKKRLATVGNWRKKVIVTLKSGQTIGYFSVKDRSASGGKLPEAKK